MVPFYQQKTQSTKNTCNSKTLSKNKCQKQITAYMKHPEMVFGMISTVQTLEEVHKSNLFAQAWRSVEQLWASHTDTR